MTPVSSLVNCHLVGGVQHPQAGDILVPGAPHAGVTAGPRPVHIHSQVSDKQEYLNTLNRIYCCFKKLVYMIRPEPP